MRDVLLPISSAFVLIEVLAVTVSFVMHVLSGSRRTTE